MLLPGEESKIITFITSLSLQGVERSRKTFICMITVYSLVLWLEFIMDSLFMME